MKRSLVAVAATLAAVALAGFVVSPAFGGPGFLTLTRAKKIFVTKASAGAYLTKTEAAAGYLGKGDASSTYLSKADAGSTYLGKGEAESTYLSKADAQRGYVGKAEADAKYLPSSATSTYEVSSANWVAMSASSTVTYAANVVQLLGTGEPMFTAATTLPAEIQGRPVSIAGMELCFSLPVGTVTDIMLVVGNEAPINDSGPYFAGGCINHELPTPVPIGSHAVQPVVKAAMAGTPLIVERLTIKLTD